MEECFYVAAIVDSKRFLVPAKCIQKAETPEGVAVVDQSGDKKRLEDMSNLVVNSLIDKFWKGLLMNRSQVEKLTDMELREEFRKSLQRENEATTQTALFAAEMHRRGFDMKEIDPVRLSRYLDIAEGRLTAELVKACGFNNPWLSTFRNYSNPLKERIVSGKFRVISVDRGKPEPLSLSFSDMTATNREQVFF